MTDDINGAAPLKLTRHITKKKEVQETKRRSNYGQWPLPVQPKWKFARSERITTLTSGHQLKNI